MTSLKIAKNLKLPIETVTSTLIVYGGKGTGKTSLLSVVCEEFAKAHLRFSVMDPMGVCWGLQHGADRTRKGIDVLIMGGIHGDIPIEPTAGAVVADLVVDETVSTIIDISRHANGKMWKKAERIRFVADYFERLYERQGEERIPIFQWVDEAARFLPQQIPHGAVDIARCVGAIESVGEEGRNIGIGLGLLAQRSARLNKSVAELADCMFAFRTVGPNSIKAILDWFGEHVPKERWNELVAKIRVLPIGQALIVSPGWLQYEGVGEIRTRETFDSSATPKPGKSLKAPGKATKPDLKKYRERMKATIEKAAAEDPRVLRARNQELERQLKARVVPSTAPTAKAETKTVEVPVIKAAQIKRLEGCIDAFARAIKHLDGSYSKVEDAAGKMQTALFDIGTALNMRPSRPQLPPFRPGFPAEVRGELKQVSPAPRPMTSPGIPLKTPKTGSQGYSQDLIKGQLKILRELAARHPAGYSRSQVGALTGYTPSGGTFGNYFSNLKRLGFIEERGGLVYATQYGIRHLGTDIPPAPASHEEVMAMWQRALVSGAYRMLDVIVSTGIHGVSREALASSVDMTASGGTFGNYLSTLRRNGLVTEQGGLIIATDILWP